MRIAVSLSKGGVGKSTTAVSLAHGLARKGRRVLLIDTDTQAQCSQMLGVKPKAGLAELLDGKVSHTEALTSARANLWLLAGSRALGEAKRLIARRDIRSEAVLSEALEPYSQFDYVVLDTSPGWDSLSVNVLFYADTILSPVSLEALSVDGLASFLKSVEPIQKYTDVAIEYILPTFMDGRVKKSQEILDQLVSHFLDKVCAPIRYSVRLSEAPAFGQTIFEHASSDRAAEDYTKLVERLL